MMRSIDGLAGLASRFDVLFCDVWGVIHDGCEAFAEPCEALARWRAECGPVVLISNSPRPAGPLIEQLDAIGVPRGAWSAVVTSGDATRLLLAERAPGPAWRIGPERDQPLYCGIDLRFSGLQEARFISCSGLFEDETETPDDYRERLTRAAELDLEMVCANPDVVVQRGERLIYCAGALAKLYQELGGAVTMAGKPWAPIYDLACARVGELTGQPSDRRRILAIGDGPSTDLAGARSQGLASLFIATGIHGEAALGQGGVLDPRKAAGLLARSGERADFVMAELAWRGTSPSEVETSFQSRRRTVRLALKQRAGP